MNGYILQQIQKFKINNQILTNQCNNVVFQSKRELLLKLPKNKDFLKIELLKKILPLDFDREYVENDNLNPNKTFESICVLFTDIVSYTELAKKYDDEIIFNLLNAVYNKFDNIIKNYTSLQKIETIGDAYMAVGDTLLNTLNNYKVVEDMILLSHSFLREIKHIKTPDNKPLSIRIGINMGSVIVGILGNQNPRFCVVGNVVNVASRLESTAETNTIQLAENVYNIAKTIQFPEEVEYIKKEGVVLKGIGVVDTYTIRPPFGRYYDYDRVRNEL